MSKSSAIVTKKVKTINSETQKIFMVVFAILLLVGLFTVGATYGGYRTFNEIKGVQIPQFQAAEKLKQKASDIVGVFYLVAGDADLEVQMNQMYRYEELKKAFDDNLKSLADSASNLGTAEGTEKLKALAVKTSEIFERLNTNARTMTLANMENRRDEGKKSFALIVKDIDEFIGLVDQIESVVLGDLDRATNSAQRSLRNSSIMGILATVSSIFIALGLIRYLMNFLSISLLPIVNLMHNLRQAVFSINKKRQVISPVSKYSQTVFQKDIVDADIFDLAFNSLGQKSEAFAAVSTALTAVFGEDDMQWSLMEDNFPSLVSLRDSSGGEKILKLTYAPLYQADNTVQDIMIVAEDVTELEKIKRLALAKQSEVLVIQGLVGVDRGDLEAFLADTLAGISQCYDLIGNLETDMESRKLLFRILHTIKGNSRLYNLSTISGVVHVAEGSVVEINNRLDNKDPVGSEFYAQLTSGLRQIEAVVAAHTKTASQLFGITDAAAERREDLLHQQILAIEDVLVAGQPVVFDKLQVDAASLRVQYVVSGLAPTLQESLETSAVIAKHFGSQDLQEKFDALTAAAKSNELKSADQIALAREVYFRFFFQSPRKAKANLSADDFIEPLQKLVKLTKAMKGPSPDAPLSEGDKSVIELALFEFFAICETQKRLEFRFFAQKMAIVAASGWSREEMNSILKQIWQNVGIILHIDSSFILNAGEKSAARQAIEAGMSGDGEQTLDFESDDNSLTIDVLKMSDQLGATLPELAGFLNLALGVESVASLADFLAGSEITQGALQKIFGLILDGVTTDANSEAYTTAVNELPSEVLKAYLTRGFVSAGLRVGIYKTLANYMVDKSLVTEESAKQSYEVSAQWYDDLTGLVEELSEAEAGEVTEIVESLEDLLASLFDYPIKALCAKMEPMMREISRNLGKNINYVVSGDAVSMPRELAYALRDAMVHMLRNSLDHGIEMPNTRSAAAKPDVATIEINCTGDGETIRVLVKDDGAGINVDKVVAKALSMNMITQEQLNAMTPMQRQELIFLSRLSTKDEVSSLSGRGVGMDAVRAIVIDRMHGKITLDSHLGKGSVFSIEIPKPKRRKGSGGAQNEVATFLIETKLAIQTCLPLIDSMLTNAESARKIFRNLHTIKGSATMHNLKGIADMVHFSESIVSAVSVATDNKQPVDDATLDKLRTSLKKILEVVDGQLKFHRQDGGSGERSERDMFIDDAGREMGEAAALLTNIGSDPEAGRKLFQILHTMKSNAQMHKINSLAEAIHSTENIVSAISEKVAAKTPVDAAELKAIEQAVNGVVQELVACQKKSSKSSNRQGGGSGARSERDMFIDDAAREMGEAAALLTNIGSDPEAGRKLFQILHTMKSNAQMHKINSLAEAIHSTENIVSAISEKVAAKTPVDAAELKAIEQAVNGVVQELVACQKKSSKGAKQH